MTKQRRQRHQVNAGLSCPRGECVSQVIKPETSDARALQGAVVYLSRLPHRSGRIAIERKNALALNAAQPLFEQISRSPGQRDLSPRRFRLAIWIEHIAGLEVHVLSH